MTESDARTLLLVRAFESPVAAPWSEADRDASSREALRAEGAGASAEALLTRRAAIALPRLAARQPAVATALAAADTRRPWIAAAVLAAAFVAGIATDAVGATQRVNILAPPLLALLAWNLAVYALLAIGVARADAFGPLRRAVSRWPARAATAAARAVDGSSAALARFATDWAAASRPLLAARSAALLHGAAFALALGALASLYLRGLAFEYRAGWDSTFLDAQPVHRLLGFVLGPASRLSGLAVPDAAQIESLRFSHGSGENAARWIHLWALTIALAVLVPRALLALLAAWRARRLERDFPLAIDDAYFRRAVAAGRTDAPPVQVWPYSYALPRELLPALQSWLERSIGSRVTLRLADPVPQGAEDRLDALLQAAPAGDTEPAARMALFALTATPERETHGAFVAALAARCVPPQRVAVLVDESGFRRRFTGADAAARLEQRRAAWRNMLHELGHDAEFADLGAAR